MSRAARVIPLVAVCALLGSPALSAPTVSRHHHLHAITPPLQHSLDVDEQEWSVRPSHTVVAAGRVTFHAYDRGMDAHNMTVIDPDGAIVAQVWMQPGGSQTVTVTLTPGVYQLVCTLFAGTPESHEMMGMHALLTVR